MVFDVSGPRYVNVDSLTDTLKCRRAGNIYYTHAFAEFVRAEIIMSKAKVNDLIPKAIRRAIDHGNALASLYPLHCKSWWPLIEDVFNSTAANELMDSYFSKLLAHNEMKSLSIDSTMRCCFGIFDQKGQKANRRKVITVRGLTSCPLLIHPLRSDHAVNVKDLLCETWSLDIRSKVEFIAVDNPSRRYWTTLLSAFPNMKVMVLDTVHLAIAYEVAYWKKRTSGSRKLRSLMVKFERRDPSKSPDAWGCIYTGDVYTPSSNAEDLAREQIWNGSMSRITADHLLKNLDYNMPWTSRLEFVKAIAALVVIHADEMNKIAPGPNRSVREILYTATSPDRLEWYMNNIRMRRSSLTI